MRKLVTVVSIAAMVFGMASLAAAEDGNRFERARKIIETSGVRVLDAVPGKDFRGAEALVLSSDMKVDEVVKHFKTLYLSGEKIDDTRVVGIAHVVKGDTWNISLRKGNKLTTFKVAGSGDGSTLTIRKTVSLKRAK